MHPKKIDGFDSLEDLAFAIGNMTYDQTASFIEKLADDIKRQADDDFVKGRKKLASELYSTADALYKSSNEMYKACDICKPYMDS